MAKTRLKRRYAAQVIVSGATPESPSRSVIAAKVRPTDVRGSLAGTLYAASMWVCLLICTCHILSLTLVVGFDGNWYVHLAEILGTKRFPGEWDFLRTPLFPAILKIVFSLIGRQAMSVIGLQTALACASIWLLGRCLYRMGRPVEAAAGMVLLTAYPTLIAYEHTPLTEVGTFFFLAWLVYAIAIPEGANIRGSIAVALIVSAGYYFRSSLLYLAPLAGAICTLKVMKAGRQADGKGSRRRLLAATFFIVSVIPFILAYPWQRYPKIAERNGNVLLFGLVRQYVLPPNDPLLGDAAPAYDLAVRQSMSNGVLPDDGIQGGRAWPVIDSLSRYNSTASSIFLRAIRSEPKRYLAGVGRNLVLYSGFGGFHYDNASLRNQVLISSGNKIDRGPEWFPPLGAEFQRHTVPSFTSRALLALSPLYDRLVMFGFVATLIACILAVLRLDTAMMAFTILPLAFILLHAILLMSQDRMVLPTYPFLLINLVLFPARLKAFGAGIGLFAGKGRARIAG